MSISNETVQLRDLPPGTRHPAGMQDVRLGGDAYVEGMKRARTSEGIADAPAPYWSVQLTRELDHHKAEARRLDTQHAHAAQRVHKGLGALGFTEHQCALMVLHAAVVRDALESYAK